MDDKIQLAELNSTVPEEVLKVKNSLKDLFCRTKDALVMKVVYNYYLSHNTARIDEVMYLVNEPHDIHFFDKVAEGLKSDQKIPHSTILGQIVRMNPLWLHKISKHNVLKELINLLKVETDSFRIVDSHIITTLAVVDSSLFTEYFQSFQTKKDLYHSIIEKTISHDVVANCMNLLMCSYDSNMTPDCEIKTSIDWEHL